MEKIKIIKFKRRTRTFYEKYRRKKKTNCEICLKYKDIITVDSNVRLHLYTKYNKF